MGKNKSSLMRISKSEYPFIVLKYIILGIIFTISVVPFVWLFISSFKSDTEIFTTAFSLPEKILYTNYVKVFEKTPIIRFFINSVIVATSSVILSMSAYGLAAYMLARFNFKFRQTIFIGFCVSLLVPSTAIILPVYLTFTKLGLYDTKIGLIIIYTAFSMPVSLFILRSYFLTIPRELEEAAYIDGSGIFATFIRIILPIAKPAFASAAVFSFLIAWNDFLYAFMLTKSNSQRTLPVSLKYFMGMYASDYNQMFAAASIILIPTIIMYLLMQKQITRGLIAGSVKG